MRLILHFLLFLVISIQSTSAKTHHGHHGIPHSWQKMCPFLEFPVEGDEGKGGQGREIKGVMVLFRHGERSGYSGHEEPNGCIPHRYKDEVAFAEYVKHVKSEKFSQFLKIKSKHPVHPVPHSSHCSSGQLTAEGALNMYKLGRFLGDKYLGDLAENGKVTVISTNYNRTIQSAIAVMAGFMHPIGVLDPVTIKVANNTALCAEDSCQCPILDKVWWKRAAEEEYSVYKETASEEIRDVVEKLKRIPTFEKPAVPYFMLDTAFSRIICRRKQMPCHDGLCATYDDFDQMLNFTTTGGNYWFNEKEKFMRYKADHVKAYTILSQLVEEVSRVAKNKGDSFIRMLSAHDVTLAAVLRVLGVPFVDPVRYSSRIVFELLQLHPSRSFAIRVLYNGDDVTRSIDFCDESPCPQENFEAFLPTILERLGIETMSEICHPR